MELRIFLFDYVGEIFAIVDKEGQWRRKREKGTQS